MRIDDSALFHAAGTYDPVKAREYYLRTRKLKGRRRVSASIGNPGRGGRRPSNPGRQVVTGSSSLTEKRRAELLAQREALQKRLDVLENVLREAVAVAKKRSGAPAEKQESKSKDQAPETQRDKADRAKESKKSKPETAAQKRERAKRDKESYEKEKKTSLSTDIKVLRSQIKNIKSDIAKALSDAEKRQKSRGKLQGSTSALTPRAGVRGSYATSSEPRGR